MEITIAEKMLLPAGLCLTFVFENAERQSDQEGWGTTEACAAKAQAGG